MLQNIVKLIDANQPFHINFKGELISNDVNRVQLLASLSKPMLYYYFISLFESGGEISQTDPIGAFLDTSIKGSLKDLMGHRVPLYDYLEMSEIAINDSSLDEMVSSILQKSDQSTVGKYSYSNSGYVLLSKIIEVIEGKSYEDFLTKYYSDLGVTIEFDPCIPRYESGWGDGAVLTNIENYLKFLSIKGSMESFESLRGAPQEIKYFCGSGVGIETFACVAKDLKIIYFSKNSEKDGVVESVLNFLAK